MIRLPHNGTGEGGPLLSSNPGCDMISTAIESKYVFLAGDDGLDQLGSLIVKHTMPDERITEYTELEIRLDIDSTVWLSIDDLRDLSKKLAEFADDIGRHGRPVC